MQKMSFDETIEALIKEAQERGEFDNLPGKGQPLNLKDYFDTPEDVRVAQSVLKNAGLLPLEIDLLHDIARLKESLKMAGDEIEKESIRKKLRDKQLQVNLLLERLNR